MPTFSERVFDIVKQIPEGKVSTYGQIARMMGSPRSARYVGWALRGNKEPVSTPCHRTVVALLHALQSRPAHSC